jgi:pyruvate kinase
MIARGDLGVELPAKKVPFVQDKLIETCISNRKPVIVATQMLESMIEHGRPTRAEVTDVSAACLSGADAVMLSGETASGKYPAEALAMMDAILRETESYRFFSRGGLFRDAVSHREGGVQDSVSAAISQLSRDLMVRCIIVETRTGRTAFVISSDRPSSPIIALTPSERVLRRLQLLWGVVPYLMGGSHFKVDKSLGFVENLMKKLKLAKSGDYQIMVRGIGYRKTDMQSITIHQMA